MEFVQALLTHSGCIWLLKQFSALHSTDMPFEWPMGYRALMDRLYGCTGNKLLLLTSLTCSCLDGKIAVLSYANNAMRSSHLISARIVFESVWLAHDWSAMLMDNIKLCRVLYLL